MDYPNIHPMIPLPSVEVTSDKLYSECHELEPDPVANIVNSQCTHCGALIENSEAAVEYCPDCCYKIIQLHANSVIQAFELWDSEMIKCTEGAICSYAKAIGGPAFYTDLGSCSNKLHSDVGYAHKHCPHKCPEFKLKSRNKRIDMFRTNYSMYPSFYNEKYNIDRGDKDYIRGYKPDPYSFNLI